MSVECRIAQVEAHVLRPSPRSVWIVVEVTTADGLSGVGEASLHFSASEVRDCVMRLGAEITGLDVRVAIGRLAALAGGDLVRVSARCGLDQALHDLEGQRLNASIARLMRNDPAREIAVYANINRRTSDRSAEGFAASARRAAAAGFEAVKIAPFDDLTPGLDREAAIKLTQAGFARIAAARDALGARAKLMVDCHWRLPAGALGAVIDACAANDVFWLETPFPEDEDHIRAIRDARRAANARGIMLAGCELKTGRAGFDPFLDAGCYDVVMPDMKYVGGYADFMAVSEAAAATGVKISPHNPTGPVCHAHSVQASAAADEFLILEMQFDETPAFAEIVSGVLPMPARGIVKTPDRPGLGLKLKQDRMRVLEQA